MLKSRQIHEFLTRSNLAVISTVAANDLPEAALINFGVTKDLELIFETLQTSRKYVNIRHNPHVALVMGFSGECMSCQYEGVVDRPEGRELRSLLQVYFRARPEALGHRDWPGLVYLRVRPRWIRLSSYGPGLNWNVEEWRCRGETEHAVAQSGRPSAG